MELPGQKWQTSDSPATYPENAVLFDQTSQWIRAPFALLYCANGEADSSISLEDLAHTYKVYYQRCTPDMCSELLCFDIMKNNPDTASVFEAILYQKLMSRRPVYLG